ncbi:DUF1598 domain-containing protein [Aeoliella sp. ICT_H6.2]|uniref:DUF1598 domain-containing protein n=1 Tax=Aeoliella straminimaris TaxID=2954799 RepID=A0A9X2JJC2_9BACT|nr:DUF1598 domain-containing protein [Aeoliella straminimaris]MCO6046588.1 DUF1598 domain-containing protein [Aeoliella straminimaris]
MRFMPRLSLLALAIAAVLVAQIQPTYAGGFIRSNAVGGVSIDPEGVVSNPEVGDPEQLAAAWKSGLDEVPGDIAKKSNLRFVSLREMEAIVAEKREAGLPVPDEVMLMAGLQRVQYVLVYPETGDIVLAGPAEGWRVDNLGNVVGQTTGRPVVALDDFMVALRAAMAQPGAGMSCSIDPTPEGLANVQKVSKRFTPNTGPERASKAIADAMGYQTISVTGIPATSHFARTLVAADFRMKRLAMGFEPSPVEGMPSYLELLGKKRGRISQNMLPRWWLAADYQPMLRDESGLAWELRGQGVKCMTEEDYVNSQGEKTGSGKANGPAQQWADTFTDKFEELEAHDSAFGQLRNVMDLAVVTTLIVHEGMAEQVGLQMPWLAGKFEVDQFSAPKQVATQTTFIRASGRWLISASGGVQILPGEILSASEKTEKIAAASQGTRVASEKSWWWDAK